jgi:hypothetical protein
MDLHEAIFTNLRRMAVAVEQLAKGQDLVDQCPERYRLPAETEKSNNPVDTSQGDLV